MESRRIDLPLQGRAAEFNSVDMKERTARLVWTTGAVVMRRDFFTGEKFMERLAVDKRAVRLDRLNSGAPLLDSHRSYGLSNVIGVIETGSARIKDGEGTATVRFSAREMVEPIFRDVAEGIIRNVSVGYLVHAFEETVDKKTKMMTRTAVDWEPMELSLVPVPADAGAQVRADVTELWPCEIVRNEEPTKVMLDVNSEDMKRVIKEMLAADDPVDDALASDVARALPAVVGEVLKGLESLDDARLAAIVRRAKAWADARM